MSEKFYLDGVQISKVLIVGYGSTGKSIHEFLKALVVRSRHFKICR